MHLRPKGLEALPLSNAPPRIAGALGIGRADVDVDSTNLKRVRAVERKDAAVRALELRVEHPTYTDEGGEHDGRDGKSATKHSARLLATMAWKSKRLVSTARRE